MSDYWPSPSLMHEILTGPVDYTEAEVAAMIERDLYWQALAPLGLSPRHEDIPPTVRSPRHWVTLRAVVGGLDYIEHPVTGVPLGWRPGLGSYEPFGLAWLEAAGA